MTERIYLDQDWRFTESYTKEMLKETFDDSVFTAVRLPHTVKETPFHYFDESIYQMEAGYRRWIDAPKEWENKNILLTFEGAAHEAEVFLNGESIATHHCGYTAFTVNLKKKLIYGEKNLLVVRLDSRETLNIPPFGHVVDYMTYGGLYRDVYIDVEPEVYIRDVFVKSNQKPDEKGNIQLETQLVLNRIEEGCYLRQSIRKWEADGSYKSEKIIGESSLRKKHVTLSYQVEQPKLWSVKEPNLYLLTTQIRKGEEVLAEKTVRFGFRQAEFKADGFYLNGKKTKLFGVNRHQSYPYVGYAMPASIQRNDADLLKQELHLNAVRTSHYPQSHYFLDRCDELGLLVFTEMPGWQHIGDLAWKKQAVMNVKEMVEQYRNHPSIILWGVRINESADDNAFYKKTNEVAHKLDNTRATGGVRCIKKSNLYEDVYTYNDFVHDGKAKGVEPKKNVTSDMNKAYLVSEYCGHMYPTKSFDWEEHRMELALRHANILDEVRKQTDIAGSFAWCMFDYNTHMDFGSGDRICYHGVMDMFRNPKLVSALYASQDNPKETILEISSSMDIGEHPGCNRGKVYAFTNADSVRMYKNDQFICEFGKENTPYPNLKHGPILLDDYIGDQLKEQKNFKKGQERTVKKILNDAAIYGLGSLPVSTLLSGAKAVLGYRMRFDDAVQLYNKYIGDWGGNVTTYRFEAIRDGMVAKTQVKGPMHQILLEVSPDKTELREDHTYDVAAIRMRATDENGNVLSFCNNPVQLKVTGPAELIGPECVVLKGGMAGTYLRTTGEKGEVELSLQGQDMAEVKLKFIVR